jgi:hypothetical protein
MNLMPLIAFISIFDGLILGALIIYTVISIIFLKSEDYLSEDYLDVLFKSAFCAVFTLIISVIFFTVVKSIFLGL